MTTNKKAMISATVLHVGALLALLLQALLGLLKSEPERHVFELVSESPPSPENSPPAPQQNAQPEPEFQLPEVRPMEELRDPVIPPPAPEPAPQPQPRPQPTPTPQAAAPEPPPRQLQNVRDFQQRQNIRDQPQAQRPTPTRRVEAPTINTAEVRRNLNNLITSSTERERVDRMSAEEQDALVQYGARLNARIDRAWGKPENLERGLSAQVSFDVAANGRITNIRFRPGSGNAAFDASVRRAIETVGNGGPTPTRQNHTFTMTFLVSNN